MKEIEPTVGDGYTLVTGASGRIGGAFARQLSEKRPVVCLSRKKTDGDVTTAAAVQGEFHSFEDLRQLDPFDISCVVHLAAVTGGCSEEDGLDINVLGTRRLLRYALDRGCRKFVLASSIAAAGCLSDAFLPLQLPIPDEHPCLAYDAYGLSKAMMEELTRYFHRAVPDSDFINLRIGLVERADAPHLFRVGDPLGWPFVNLARITLGDLLKALDCAVAAPPRPGVRVINVVTQQANCGDPVPAVLRACLGERAEELDLSWYERPGHAYDALYATDKLQGLLGSS
jgi:UDP-glucose 4-epimerase